MYFNVNSDIKEVKNSNNNMISLEKKSQWNN